MILNLLPKAKRFLMAFMKSQKIMGLLMLESAMTPQNLRLRVLNNGGKISEREIIQKQESYWFVQIVEGAMQIEVDYGNFICRNLQTK